MIENRTTWQDLLFTSADRVDNLVTAGERSRIHGITLAALRQHRAPAEVTIDDLRQLALEEAKIIANLYFWAPIQGDKLPGGLDLACAMVAWHSGPRIAVRILQQCLGFKDQDVDGFVGIHTLKAVLCVATAPFIKQYMAAILAFLKGRDPLVDDPAWLKRFDRIQELALAMAPDGAPAQTAAKAVTRTKLVANASVGAVVVSLVQPLVEAIPAAKSGFTAAASLVGPYEVVLPGIGLALGGVVIVGILYTKGRAARLGKSAIATGSSAAVTSA